MKLNEIKYNDIVKLRNGEYGMIVGDTIAFGEEDNQINNWNDCYNSDLLHIYKNGWDILEIYEMGFIWNAIVSVAGQKLSGDYKLVAVRSMNKQDVCARLGFQIDQIHDALNF